MDNSTPYTSPTTKPLYRGYQVVWYIVYLIEILLLFRFGLKLLAANPTAGFTDFIYDLSYIFAAPFLNVFRITRIEGSVFEWPTLLAIITYWILGIIISKLFVTSRTVSRHEAAEKLKEKEDEQM